MKITTAKKLRVGTTVAALALLLSTVSANAATYNFYKLTNNNVEDLENQLSVEVLDVGGTQVSFTFMNNVGISSSITDIYFDDGLPAILALPFAYAQSAGVSFTSPANPGNLPGGNTAIPAFVTSAGFSADSATPAGGVDVLGEYVTLILNYTGVNTIASVLAALGSGDLRIGLHVQSIGVADGSDGYINQLSPNQTVVPLPAGILLLISALGGLGFLARFRKKLA